MERIDDTAVRALRTLLENQPLTEAKVAFAWRIAAGETLARASTVSWATDGTLSVQPRTDAWRNELVRARPMVAERLTSLLGRGAVKKISIFHAAGELPNGAQRFSR